MPKVITTSAIETLHPPPFRGVFNAKVNYNSQVKLELNWSINDQLSSIFYYKIGPVVHGNSNQSGDHHIHFSFKFH